MIVWYLQDANRRFKDLLEVLPDISSKVLSEQLAEMEDDNIIVRQSYNEVPPRVEYSLSDYGKTLAPVLDIIKQWGFNHLKRHPKILHKDSRWKSKLQKPRAKS